jgi:hypothetical protein
VFTGVEPEGPCVAQYSQTSYGIDVNNRSLSATVPFVQTAFGVLGGDGQFELNCPTGIHIHGLTCKSLNARTIELTSPEPATLRCTSNSYEVGSHATLRDEQICDVGGWPRPPLKITGLGADGRVAGLTIGRSPTDPSKVVLNGRPTGPVRLYDVTITADAPPYPSQNMKIAKCNDGDREETDDCP